MAEEVYPVAVWQRGLGAVPYLQVRPVFDARIRGACARPYAGHPRGCPNFSSADRCPPRAPLLFDAFDEASPFFAVYSTFALGEHVRRLRESHPTWSERQLSCVLYWQGTARKKLREEVTLFMKSREGSLFEWTVETTPEAMGCDVFQTMANAGVVLPWPPKEVAYHVALAGVRAATHPRKE